MKINVGKTIRIGDIINPDNQRGLWMDTSVTASVGSISGLEKIGDTIGAINTICDAIIVNPGQLEHHAELLGGSRRAAPIVRLDWTNYFRDDHFCLPAKQIQQVMISSIGDAMTLGASAAIVRYLMGMADEFEAENVQSISFTAKEAYRESLPLIVEICPIGEKVDRRNFDDTIKLGVACMLEVGADSLIIPECSPATIREIGNWVDIPVLVKLSKVPDLTIQNQVLNAGLSGFLIDETIFADSGYSKELQNCFENIHSKK